MTPAELRALFPSVQKCIHLNHAGTSPIANPVADAVRGVLDELQSANPLAAYINTFTRASDLREIWGRMLRTESDNLAVVKNTSHGLAIIAQGIPFRAGENVVVAANEYPSNVYPWLAQESRGVSTRLVAPQAEGYVSEDDLEAACDADTRVLAASWVQWGTGQRMDLARLGAFCASRDIHLVVDAVQGFGALRLDLSTLPGVSFATGGGHKWLLAPGGVGFLYVRPDLLGNASAQQCGLELGGKPDGVGSIGVAHAQAERRPLRGRYAERDRNRRYAGIHAPTRIGRHGCGRSAGTVSRRPYATPTDRTRHDRNRAARRKPTHRHRRVPTPHPAERRRRNRARGIGKSRLRGAVRQRPVCPARLLYRSGD